MKVSETAECVFIENISRLEWGRNMENTFIKSLQSAFALERQMISYAELHFL